MPRGQATGKGSLGLHIAQFQSVSSPALLGSAAGGKRHFPLISPHVKAVTATQSRGTEGVNSALWVEVESGGP